MPNVEPAYRQAYTSVVGGLSTLERHLADLENQKHERWRNREGDNLCRRKQSG